VYNVVTVGGVIELWSVGNRLKQIIYEKSGMIR